MKTATLEDNEWQWLIATVATHLINTHPTMNKLTNQLARQQGNGDATQGLGERAHQGAVSPRQPTEITPPDHRDRHEQRPPRPAKR